MKDSTLKPTTDYESQKILSEYLLFHFGEAEDILDKELFSDFKAFEKALFFPKRLISEFEDIHKLNTEPTKVALDLGCSVGGSSFELSKHYSKVLSVDYSNSFIDSAKKIQKEQEVSFSVQKEGNISKKFNLKLEPSMKSGNIKFVQGDASAALDLAAKQHIDSFDFILAANLICRMKEPMKLLLSLPQLLKPKGHLLIASPYSWLKDYTPEKNWLGGFFKDEEEIRSLEALEKVFKNKLKLIKIKEMPFLIKEHQRKFQFSVSQASLWQKI